MKKIILLLILVFSFPLMAQEQPTPEQLNDFSGKWNIKQGSGEDIKTCIAEYIDQINAYYFAINYFPFSDSMVLIVSSPGFEITKEFLRNGPLVSFFDSNSNIRMKTEIKRLNETTYIIFVKKPFKDFYKIIANSEYFVLNAGKEFMPVRLPVMNNIFEKASRCFELRNISDIEKNDLLIQERYYDRFDKYLDRSLDGFNKYIEDRNQKFIEYLFNDFNNLKLFQHEYGIRFTSDTLSGQITVSKAIPNLESYVNFIKSQEIANKTCLFGGFSEINKFGPIQIVSYNQTCEKDNLKYFVKVYFVVNMYDNNTLKIEFLSKEKLDKKLKGFESKLYME